MKDLRTRRQMVTILFMYGYTEGTLPQQHRPESLVHVPPAYRNGMNTRARITYEGVNRANHRLYGLEFIYYCQCGTESPYPLCLDCLQEYAENWRDNDLTAEETR